MTIRIPIITTHISRTINSLIQAFHFQTTPIQIPKRQVSRRLLVEASLGLISRFLERPSSPIIVKLGLLDSVLVSALKDLTDHCSPF